MKGGGFLDNFCTPELSVKFECSREGYMAIASPPPPISDSGRVTERDGPSTGNGAIIKHILVVHSTALFITPHNTVYIKQEYLRIRTTRVQILFGLYYDAAQTGLNRWKISTPSFPKAVAQATTLAPALYMRWAASGEVTPPTPMILIVLRRTS